MTPLPVVYSYLEFTRKKDEYPPTLDAKEIISTYFPSSIQAFVQDMSDITAAFYGTMLAKARQFWGPGAVDALNVSTIMEMGIFKARQAIERYPDLPKDARGLLLILIAGIFSASPEYEFRILEFAPDRVKANIMGKDRYFRIAVRKEVQELITWPTILHFLRGANAGLGWHYGIDLDVHQLEANGDCLYEFTISPGNNTARAPLPPSFLQMPECGSIQSYGQLSLVPLGKLGQYSGAGFVTLFRKAISLEAYNYTRLEGKMLYMLAETLSARRNKLADPDADCYAVVKNRERSGKKIHAAVSIFDAQHSEIYDFRFDYYLWEVAAYEDKFSFLKEETAFREPPSPGFSGLPQPSGIGNASYHSFRSFLPAFSLAHCADHYPGYPCVPAIHLYYILRSDAIKWLNDHITFSQASAVEDYMELNPIRPIPHGVDMIIATKVIAFSKKRFRFIHEVCVGANQDCSLLVTFDLSIL